jgi:nucleoside-diphosphate-sugar epimerase
MKSILFTGATGFIGSAVLARLLKDERCPKIYLLVRRKPSQTDSLLAQRFKEHNLGSQAWDRLEWIETNFEDPSKFVAALNALPNAESWRVLHLAAIVNAKGNEATQTRLNVGVTGDLLDWSNAKARKFVYLSSVVAFGATRGPDLRSEKDFSRFDPINSHFSYNTTKREAHLHVISACKIAGEILCPSVVHGSLEGQKDSREHLKALREGRLNLAPTGGANFVSLDKVARAIVEAVLEENIVPSTDFLVRTRLIVDENLTFAEYFRRYLGNYNPKAELPHLLPVPKFVSGLALGIESLLRPFGWKSRMLNGVGQSGLYYWFKSERPLDGGNSLDEALKQSFLNPGT